jgi:hypothetical protein
MSSCSSDSARPARSRLRRIAAVAGVVLFPLALGCGSDDDTPGGNTGDAGVDRPVDVGGGGDGGGGDGGGAEAATPLTTYKLCTDETRLGEFAVQLADTFTGVEGRVFDVVNSTPLGEPVGSPMGSCQFMKRPGPTAPCDPACSESQVCTNSQCRPRPQPVGVGEVKLTGLLQPMTLQFGAQTYINPPVNPAIHPLFAPGANILLSAAGQGAYPAFTIKGYGIEPMVVPSGKLRVERGMPVTLTWTRAANPGPSKIAIDFSVNRHAATDTWFQCLVDDTGSYTISAALTDQLFALGTSGFPSVLLNRVSGDTAMVNGGCVQLRIYSEGSRELDVPGINSCKGDEDCTPPNVCGQLLTCVPPGS